MIKKLKNKKIAVIYGGSSYEREISLRTGQAVFDELEKGGYNVFLIDAKENMIERLLKDKPDIAFIALHGRGGEDGTIQSVLEYLKIPYTGSGVESSAVCMHKGLTKLVLQKQKIPTPAFEILREEDDMYDITIDYPFIVKPAREGSSIGINIVKKEKDLKKAVIDAFKYDSEVLIEKYIKGRELTVGVIKTGGETEILPIVEIVSSEKYHNYKSKYQKSRTEYNVPASLTKEEEEKIYINCFQAYNLLNCRGAARVDLILSGGVPYFIEINTIPGMTSSTSTLPKAAAAAGITFFELAEKILLDALED